MVVNLLSATLAHCCSRNQAAVGLVGTTSDLKDLIRWHAQNRPEDRRPALRAAGVTTSVAKRSSTFCPVGARLRVVNPNADVPVAVEPVTNPNVIA